MEAISWTLVGLLAAISFGNLYWLGSKIDALGARLDSRIDALDARLTGRMDAMTGRMDALTARFDAHIDQHAP